MDLTIIPNGLSESLVKEFGVAPDAHGIESCLRRLGIVSGGSHLDAYRDVSCWQPGGAETYTAVAEVIANGEAYSFIAKALWSLGQSTSSMVTAWIERRGLIAHHGIRVPRLYAVFNGTIYEEYIDYPLPAVDNLQPQALVDIGFVASVLDYLGFEPVSFLHDLRMKNNQVYYVDFGADLGSPSKPVTKLAAFETLRRCLPAAHLEICSSAYEAAATGFRSNL